jgi:hypothetical protein
MTAVPAFQVLVTAMKTGGVHDVDQAGNNLDKGSHDKSQFVDPGMSTRKQLRY